MDINTLRTLATLLCFVSFMGIVWGAWSRQQTLAFDEAARLPFADDAHSPTTSTDLNKPGASRE